MVNIASIKNQVKEAMNTINGIGTSKTESMILNGGKSPLIHSIKYMKESLGSSIRFAEYSKENFGIKSIFSLTTVHMESYMKSLSDKGLSQGSLVNIESYLSKFQLAINEFGKKIGKEAPVFFVERKIDCKSREAPKNRSYTKQEIDCLKNCVSLKVKYAIDASVNLGLRAKEVCNLRVEHLKKDKILIENGKGVTKGGRFREIPIPKDYQNTLQELVRNKKTTDKVFGIRESTLRSALNRASKKLNITSHGWHGFRHTYAREQLKKILGPNYENCKNLLSKIIDNQNNGLRMDTGIKGSDRRNYNELKEAINQVHSELGHGRRRWELIRVYMS